MIDFGEQCSWCGHKPHGDECPGVIERGTPKKPDPTPCPCRRQEHPMRHLFPRPITPAMRNNAL